MAATTVVRFQVDEDLLFSSPSVSVALLRLCTLPAVDLNTRASVAIQFKNLLLTRWDPNSLDPLPDDEKSQVKSLILPILVRPQPPQIQRPLADALRILASHDSLLSWPSLFPEIESSLSGAAAPDVDDYASVNSVLFAIHTLFLKFRTPSYTCDLFRQLQYCIDFFPETLVMTFMRGGELIASDPDPALLKPLFESQLLCTEIFHSLTFGLSKPDYLFYDYMCYFMPQFRVYLTTIFPPHIETDGTADSLRLSICETLQMFIQKTAGTFHTCYLEEFVTAVTESASRDPQLAISAIKFLTSVSTSIYHHLLGSSKLLGQICTRIVFPNLRLRDEQGTDTFTRAACELLKGLALNYREQVMSLILAHIHAILAAFNSKPDGNWKVKEAAVYLAVATEISRQL